MAENIDTTAPLRGEDLTGRKFGRMEVIGFAGLKIFPSTKMKYWICRCECGNEKVVCGSNLKNGHISSCGCFRREDAISRFTTHGMAGTPLYEIWSSMMTRCYNEKCKAFPNYGGRGIVIEEPWKSSFQAFYDDMAAGFQEGLEIDRIEVNGNYCKSNCRWATLNEQANNKRSNRLVTINGVTKSLTQWSKTEGFPSYGTMRSRLAAGWSLERAVSTPADVRFSHAQSTMPVARQSGNRSLNSFSPS